MTAALVAISVYLAVPLAVTVAGGGVRAITTGTLGRLPTRASLSCAIREWMTMALLPLLLLVGVWQLRPRPYHRAESGAQVPVVLVPGYGLNRGTFVFLATFLRRRGWRWVWGLNNRPHSVPVDTYVARLARLVDSVLLETGAERVDLVGHSMGGAVAALYVAEHGGDTKVRRLVTLGTPWAGTRMARLGLRRQARDLRPDATVPARICSLGVPVTGVWSPSDFIVLPPVHARPPCGRAVEVPHCGHLQMLLSGRVFRVVADALATPSPAGAPA